jgi:enamine deaminase RidA (YjgF/YER057c/UK114 family)
MFRNYADTDSKSEAFQYSQGVKVGNIVKCSGQGGWNTEGIIASSASEQVKLAIEKVEKALQAVNKSITWKNVYAIRSYNTNIDDSADLCIEGWRRVMPDHRPAWTCVEITKLGIEGMRIEIEVEVLAESRNWQPLDTVALGCLVFLDDQSEDGGVLKGSGPCFGTAVGLPDFLKGGADGQDRLKT